MRYRHDDFKLGVLHGKVNPQKDDSEAKIQRNVFLSQVIRIRRANDESKNTVIRLFAYEMPLGYSRDLCVDLVGYDAERNIYLIELKKGSSSENLDKVIYQINNYGKIVKKIKRLIEIDFKNTFYIPIKFKNIKKLIIAPREFYNINERIELDTSIEYLYFGVKDIIRKKVGSPVVVNVMFKNRIQ